MTRALLAAALAIAALGAACCRQASPTPEEQAAQAARDVVPGEYVFTLAPGTEPRFLQGTLSDLPVKRMQDLGGGMVLVVFSEDPGLPRLSLRVGDRILGVQPNFKYRALP